ncbi:MAG TPA: tetraacyldisaccharide 4'-kinase, partial [Thioalkalivibrio sp.]|nr:tetraacyldisaccharide 4'-kinase [Thioalkalivibrio sp.]
MGIESGWYKRGVVAYALWPVSKLFCGLVALRRRYFLLRNRLWPRLKVPVVLVVGNITMQGTGKTPMVVWLVNQLRANGLRAGVVSRGAGGTTRDWPQQVTAQSDANEVGDEAVLIATRAGCPVYVGPRRDKAARALLDAHGVDVLIADDGLQHYNLQRDIEIAMVDSRHRFGNGFCLPAGPLREPVGRLAACDFVIVNGMAKQGEYSMGLRGNVAVNIGDSKMANTLDAFRHQQVHAVAGIGHPERFFDMLRVNGIEVIPHPFPDHHRFEDSELDFDDDLPVFMTEKDAVKCRHMYLDNAW